MYKGISDKDIFGKYTLFYTEEVPIYVPRKIKRIWKVKRDEGKRVFQRKFTRKYCKYKKNGHMKKE